MNDYWFRISQQRLSRRRALAATGATATGALLLAACGSSQSGGGSKSSKSSLISDAVDTSKQAKRGGTMKWYAVFEPAHFDINIGLNPLNTPNNLTTSLLVNEKPGYLKPTEYSEVVPELAESWEWSPDRLQLTLKIRDGVKWHNKPPINGRPFDVEDIVFAWNRFAAKSQGRGNLANVANPNAPVLSCTAIDSRTVAFKLKEPIVYFLSQLTPGQTGSFQMLPKETDTTYDIRKDIIGTGPFVLSNYAPSQRMTFKRNPDYWDKTGPYIDQIEYPLITEYAQQLAQFRSGNIYTLWSNMQSGLRQEDVLPTKRDLPQLQLFLVPPYGFNMGNSIEFGTQPTEANKAFKDERVRQAFSMAIDRDTYLDVFKNISGFQSQGLPVQSYWYTALGPGPGWRLDPKDAKAFGPNARYYQHDVPEAKRLLAAAGYANGLDVITSHIKGTELNTNGDDHQKQVEVRQEMLRQIGVRPVENLIDYTTEYLPKYLANAGKFDGIVYRSGVASANDAVVWLDWRYRSGGGDGWIGFDAAGKGDGAGDPQVDSLILKARAEIDIEKRKGIVNDLQRVLAKSQYCISLPGNADTFELSWPALANNRVFNGDRRTPNVSWWIDETKEPFKKA